MLPIATAFRSAPAGSPRRAAQHLLLWIGVGIAITLAIGQDGLLINNARDGTSALLDFWSPRWATVVAGADASSPSVVHRLAAHGVVADRRDGRRRVCCARTRSTRAGRLGPVRLRHVCDRAVDRRDHHAVAADRPRPQPAIDLGARARLAALDGFDARARPASIVYDPLRKGAAIDALPQLVLGVKAGQRSDKQPVRVIHNGRFSLPAGTYTISVQFSDRTPQRRAAAVAADRPQRSAVANVDGAAASRASSSQTTLWLPVDASFVGLRGPVELERAIASITITPIAVVDAGARPLVPIVLAAADYSGATLFFHDEQLYPEPQGFWTIGGHASHVTVAMPARSHGAGGVAHASGRGARTT